jgi:hypothetical protein
MRVKKTLYNYYSSVQVTFILVVFYLQKITFSFNPLIICNERDLNILNILHTCTICFSEVYKFRPFESNENINTERIDVISFKTNNAELLCRNGWDTAQHSLTINPGETVVLK